MAMIVRSPWSLKERFKIILWQFSWTCFCAWTPKPLNRWRLLWLELFGANVHGIPFVHQRARVQIPWHVTFHDKCCVGDRSNIYSLGLIDIGEGAVVAQEAYLCTGSHLFDTVGLPLEVKNITIKRNAFIGARAFLLPGVTIGEFAIVGACSVVTRDIEALSINAGNPCKRIGWRPRGPQVQNGAGDLTPEKWT